MASRSLNSPTPGGDEKLPRQAVLLRLSAQFPGTGAGRVHSDGWTEGGNIQVPFNYATKPFDICLSLV